MEGERETEDTRHKTETERRVKVRLRGRIPRWHGFTFFTFYSLSAMVVRSPTGRPSLDRTPPKFENRLSGFPSLRQARDHGVSAGFWMWPSQIS